MEHVAFGCSKCKHVTTSPRKVSACEVCGCRTGTMSMYVPSPEARAADHRRNPNRTDDDLGPRRELAETDDFADPMNGGFSDESDPTLNLPQ